MLVWIKVLQHEHLFHPLPTHTKNVKSLNRLNIALKLRGEDYISTLKQSYLDFEELRRTQAKVLGSITTNLKQLTMLLLKTVYYCKQIFSKKIQIHVNKPMVFFLFMHLVHQASH